jgi:hypothetical protein
MESVPGGKRLIAGFRLFWWLYAGVVHRYITYLNASHPPKVMVTAATAFARPPVGRTSASTSARRLPTWMQDGERGLHEFDADSGALFVCTFHREGTGRYTFRLVRAPGTMDRPHRLLHNAALQQLSPSRVRIT